DRDIESRRVVPGLELEIRMQPTGADADAVVLTEWGGDARPRLGVRNHRPEHRGERENTGGARRHPSHPLRSSQVQSPLQSGRKLSCVITCKPALAPGFERWACRRTRAAGGAAPAYRIGLAGGGLLVGGGGGGGFVGSSVGNPLGTSTSTVRFSSVRNA